jgi:hypothetical protein
VEKPLLSIKGRNGQLELFQDRLRICRSGIISFVSHGLKGDKEIYYADISAIQFKRPGVTVGYIQFTFTGGFENRKGVFQAVSDENTVTFSHQHLKEFEILKAELERRVRIEKKPQGNAISHFYELDKLAELKEKGVVTDEEFQAAKRQLLQQSPATKLPEALQQELDNHRANPVERFGIGSLVGLGVLLMLACSCLELVLRSYSPFLIFGLLLLCAILPSLLTKRWNFLCKKRNLFAFLIFLIIGLSWMHSLTPAYKADHTMQPEQKHKAEAPHQDVPTRKLNMSHFRIIHSGMSYEQVTDLLGPGELMAESTVGNINTRAYTWRNWRGSNAIITFQNGKVISKAHAGL